MLEKLFPVTETPVTAFPCRRMPLDRVRDAPSNVFPVIVRFVALLVKKIPALSLVPPLPSNTLPEMFTFSKTRRLSPASCS
jgi:hypothetical protein